jgi:hypothetical protein
MSDFDQAVDAFVREHAGDEPPDDLPQTEQLILALRPMVAEDQAKPDCWEAAARRRILAMAEEILKLNAERLHHQAVTATLKGEGDWEARWEAHRRANIRLIWSQEGYPTKRGQQ